MAEFEENTIQEELEAEQNNFQRILGTFLKPRKTMRHIASHEKALWLFPLLVLMVSSLILTFITASIEKQTAVPVEMPPDMEYYPDEYQDQFSDVMAQNTGFVRTTLFPIIGKWLGLWSNWMLLSILLMVVLLVVGHPLEWRAVFNLAGWSALPFLLRDIIQSIFLLSSRQLISSPGLSGFGAADAAGFAAFLNILLGFLDIYLIWQSLLLLIGYKPITQMNGWKAILVLVLVFAIYLTLRSVPAYLISQVSSVFSNGMFYF